jgi:hypothetical protein
MNKTTIRNKLHQEGLDLTAKFIKSGGKVTTAPDNYEGQVWEAVRPKHRQVNRRGDSK